MGSEKNIGLNSLLISLKEKKEEEIYQCKNYRMHCLRQLFKYSCQRIKHLLDKLKLKSEGILEWQARTNVRDYHLNACCVPRVTTGERAGDTTKMTLVWVVTCAIMNLFGYRKVSWEATLQMSIRDECVTQRSQPLQLQ